MSSPLTLDEQLTQWFSPTKFLVDKDKWAFVPGRYHVYNFHSNRFLSATQKGFWKPSLTISLNDSISIDRTKVFRIETRMFLRMAYNVVNSSDNTIIGILICKNMYKDEWQIYNAYNQPVGSVTPRVHNLFDFSYIVNMDRTPVCHLKPRLNIADAQMEVEFVLGEGSKIDKRLGIAIGLIMLLNKGYSGGAA